MLDYYCTKQTVTSLVTQINHLEKTQRPLIIVDSKYPYIAATKDEIKIIENEEGQ
jgi:hypothetical protein